MSINHYIRSFNRFELKYIIPQSIVSEFIQAMGEYVYPDSNCTDEYGYPIYSLYCDSPNLSFFWEKIEGLKFRRKVRFRRYSNDPGVFLEIKQRVGHTLQKRRVRWPLERVVQTFCANAIDDIDIDHEQREPVVSEILFLWRYYGLQPCMEISYRRRAFFAAFEPDLRITFDTRVQYHAGEFDITCPFTIGKYILEPDLAIMEVKFSDKAPIWLSNLIGKYQLHQVRLSKYCTAIDRAYFKGHMT